MRALIDTNVWLWSRFEPNRLNAEVRRILESQNSILYLSAVSVLELSIKAARGRLSLPEPIENYVPSVIREDRLVELPVTHQHALAVARLDSKRGDPFDRLLMAQAECERLTLITGDEEILRLSGRAMDARS